MPEFDVAPGEGPFVTITWRNQAALVCSIVDRLTIENLANGMDEEEFRRKTESIAASIVSLLNGNATIVKPIKLTPIGSARKSLRVVIVDTQTGELNDVLLQMRIDVEEINVLLWCLLSPD